ncbi:MAG: hypothetical protein AAF652_13740 [Cyanobacteria bacterium P01_C01_bin.72]
MVYSLTETTQKYGEQSYQAFKLAADNPADEQHFFGQRVQGFGILSFGFFSLGQRKTISLAEAGIQSPISLRSIFAFVPKDQRSIDDEITFFLNRGDEDLGKVNFRWNQIPVQLPAGAIVTPDMSITVEAKSNITLQNVQIYWQPVYMIHYFNYEEVTR